MVRPDQTNRSGHKLTQRDFTASILVAVASLNKWELVRAGFSHMSSRQYQE